MSKVEDLLEILAKKSEGILPDCIVTHDFEGGHNGHDAVSFVASQTAAHNTVRLCMFFRHTMIGREKII